MTDRCLHVPRREPKKSTSKVDLRSAATDFKHHKQFKTILWGVKINVR